MSAEAIDWNWVGTHGTYFESLLEQHLELSLIPIAIGIPLALLLGAAGHASRRLNSVLLVTTSVLYALPSIALFVFLIDFTGLSSMTAIIPLTLYSLAVLYRNVVGGLDSVDPAVRQAAASMGLGRLRMLLQVEIPIATPVIISGVRIATVINVSMVSIAALIGLGGLGQLFTEGLQRFFLTEILAGVVLVMALALVLDLVLLLAQRALTPWARR